MVFFPQLSWKHTTHKVRTYTRGQMTSRLTLLFDNFCDDLFSRIGTSSKFREYFNGLVFQVKKEQRRKNIFLNKFCEALFPQIHNFQNFARTQIFKIEQYS